MLRAYRLQAVKHTQYEIDWTDEKKTGVDQKTKLFLSSGFFFVVSLRWEIRDKTMEYANERLSMRVAKAGKMFIIIIMICMCDMLCVSHQLARVELD